MSWRAAPRLRARRLVVSTLIVAVLLAVLAVAGHSTLGRSVSLLAQVRWHWILFAVLAELSSMSAFARAQRHLLRAGGADVQLVSVLAVTYAGNAVAVSLPVAGAAASVAFFFTEYRRRGIDPVVTSWALTVTGLTSSFTLALLLAGGALAVGNDTAAGLGFLGALLSLSPLAAVFATLRSARARTVLGRWAARGTAWWQRRAHRPGRDLGAAFEGFLERLGAISCPAGRYLRVLALSLWNWVASALCLACCIRAVGSPVPWRGLALAYGAGAGAGVVPLTPGGVGIVEVALSAALVVAGLPAARALAAVLVYRLISFWFVMGLGWVVMALLRRRRSGLPPPGPPAAG